MEKIIFKNVSSLILKEVSFSIYDKSIISLVGDITIDEISDLIMGFSRITEGKMFVFNHKLDKSTTKRENLFIQNKMGYVFDDPKKFLTNKTVWKEVTFGLNYLGFSEVEKLTQHYLSLFGVEEVLWEERSLDIPLTYQKKVMLAATLAINPQVIILNYVDKDLAFKDRKNLKRILVEEKKKGKSIIILSKDPNFYYDIVDEVLFFKDGKFIESGDEEVFYKEDVESKGDLPEIVDFIKKYNNSTFAPLYRNNDLKDLLKDIYRIKNNIQR